MKEFQKMRSEKQLLTKKQYQKCLGTIIFLLTFSGAITLAGLLIALVSDLQNIIFSGITVGIIGFILLIISLVVSFKYAGKIQLYRYFKNHPEEFETDIKQ